MDANRSRPAAPIVARIDCGHGLVTRFKAPGGFAIELHQRRYRRRAARA